MADEAWKQQRPKKRRANLAEWCGVNLAPKFAAKVAGLVANKEAAPRLLRILQTLRELQQAGAYFLLPGPRALGLWPPLPGGASGPPTGTAPQRLCPHQPAPLFQPHPLKPASVETYWL